MTAGCRHFFVLDMQVFACLYFVMQVFTCLLQPRLDMPLKEIDQVFKALADPSRRELVDRLHARDGQTLSELCQGLDMARQSVTQHLGVLEDANLISVVRDGREKLHYFNPVPIHDIYQRWIRKFETERLDALAGFKAKLERK
jgi:DNA-binding transcriptional ArsR family regulator